MAEHRTGTSAYSCTFSYDGVGNRLTSTAQDGAVTSYVYNPAHELLTTQPLGVAPTTFGYDAAGNTVREVGPSADVTYTWDGENRLTQVDSGGSMETYTYDATGLRRRRTTGDGTTHFVWDRVNLLSELDGNLARTAQYTDFPGVWGGLSSQRRNGTSRHFVHDLSANTRALLDGGAVTDSYLYRAFGVEEATSGSTTNVLRFGGQVGHYRDLADRLYVRARYYRPGVGRWVTRDRISYVWPSGQYGYAINRPTVLADPPGALVR